MPSSDDQPNGHQYSEIGQRFRRLGAENSRTEARREALDTDLQSLVEKAFFGSDLYKFGRPLFISFLTFGIL